MEISLAHTWQKLFWDVVRQPEYSDSLRDSGIHGKMNDWTTVLTQVVVITSQKLGWIVSAKGHSINILPVKADEFLGMDIMAFPGGSRRWQLPIAVMELENIKNRSAYSLWKLLCIRASLRILFCYCESAGERKEMIRSLTNNVIGAMSISERQDLDGKTLLTVGSRDNAEQFPYGFFKWWNLDKNTGQFTLI